MCGTDWQIDPESPWRARVPRLAVLLAGCGACVVGVPRPRQPLSIPPP